MNSVHFMPKSLQGAKIVGIEKDPERERDLILREFVEGSAYLVEVEDGRMLSMVVESENRRILARVVGGLQMEPYILDSRDDFGVYIRVELGLRAGALEELPRGEVEW